MAAAPEFPPWATLPGDCLREVFSRVPCLVDRLSAFRACPRWLVALKDVPPPRTLPSLLFPAPNPIGYGYPSVVACVHEEGHRHHCHPPIGIPRGARCFGCYEGGWLFLAVRDPRGHKLFNIRTGAIRDLPRDMELHLSPFTTATVPMNIIHGVALSAAPGHEDCVAVCIVTITTRRCVARWSLAGPGMGQQLASEIRPPGPDFNFVDAEDLVYHDDAFHLLMSRDADVCVCTPRRITDADHRVRDTEGWEIRCFYDPGRRDYEVAHLVRGRYLVSSRGQLLLVVRLAPRPPIDLTLIGLRTEHEDNSTSKFKVFRAVQRPHRMPEVDPCFPVARYPWAWSELDSLDGRILFVGCGCSRSYDQYKGVKAGIYFFDNREFYFLDAEQYLCSDNGRWSESEPEPNSVQHCLPEADPSWISPPAWLLH